jgi:hypothetical protein
MRIPGSVLGAIALVIGTATSSVALTTETPTLGKSAVSSQIAPDFNLTCGDGHRIIAIQTESSTSAILRIKVVCNGIDSTGAWSSGRTFPGWSNRYRDGMYPNPDPTFEDQGCPTNQYVVGINAYLAVPPSPSNTPVGPQYALMNQQIRRIQFACLPADGRRLTSGIKLTFKEVGASATGGAWAFAPSSLPQDYRCPVGGIASSMKGKVMGVLKTVRLTCSY